MEHPIVIRLENGDNFRGLKDKLGSKVLHSNIICQPEFNLGFHSYIHQTKNKMNITSKLETKDKFYYIVNAFESDENLMKKTSEFLKLSKESPKILSRAFFKMWEILMVFDLVDNKELTYAALAEGPGSFLQAVMEYRKKYNNLSKDKYYSITIHPEDGKNIELSKSFLGYVKESYPDLLKNHKTYGGASLKKYKSRDSGDLTDFKSISNFRKEVKKGKRLANLVSGDGGFAWNDENYQEQEAFALIIGELLGGLMIQDKGGHMVLKMFESFTKITVKILYILSSLYEEVYLYKPYFSRVSNSEKYVVCKGFRYEQKKDKNLLDVLYNDLEKILKQFDTDKYIVDIFPDLEVNEIFLNKIRLINIEIANKQQVMINRIVSYIKENNYFGDKYHKYLETHNKSIEYWIERFLVNKEKLEENKKKLTTDLKKVLSNQKSEIDEMIDI